MIGVHRCEAYREPRRGCDTRCGVITSGVLSYRIVGEGSVCAFVIVGFWMDGGGVHPGQRSISRCLWLRTQSYQVKKPFPAVFWGYF